MALEIEPVDVDFTAVDAEVARGKGDSPAKVDKSAEKEPITVETDEEPAAVVAKPIVTPEAGIEKLREQLKASESARQAAETRERETAQAEANARGEVQKTQIDLVNGAIERVTQADDQLEAKYAEAAAAGDWVAAAKAQREMSTNAAELQTLKNGKVQMEKAPKPQPRAPADPVEAYVADIGSKYPRSQAWVRAHPEFARTKDGQDMLVAAHQIALKRNLTPESDEYFKSVERTLDVVPAGAATAAPNGQDTDVDLDPMADTAATPVAPRRAAPAAAPVTRSGGNARSTNMKLTPDQVEMAKASFPNSKTPLEDYARELLALRKEGRLS